MEYKTLGRTGLRVSVVGLGAGGPSRIGKTLGMSDAESMKVVRRAYDHGITFYDTSEVYHTEGIIGRALKEAGGDDAIISTKLRYRAEDRYKSAIEIERSIDESLKQLSRDVIDIYHVHAVLPDHYQAVFEQTYPVLAKMREKGKIRSIGITEMFGRDSSHRMLRRALEDDVWDVIMVGYSMLNFSGRSLFQRTQSQNVGVLDMFAVRRALRDINSVREYLTAEVEKGELDGELLEREDPFGYALDNDICEGVPEMAYRFVLHDPGIDVVLTGTSSVAHLDENILSMKKPPLSADVVGRIETLFGGVSTLTGN